MSTSEQPNIASVITAPAPPRGAQLLGAVAVVEPARRSSAAPPSTRRPARPAKTGTRQHPHRPAAHQLEVLGLQAQPEHEERQELQDPLEVQVVADRPGRREASTAMASASGSGQRTIFHSGVVSRQMNRAARNQVRYQGSSRLIGWSGIVVRPPLEERVRRLEEDVRARRRR